ncbi:4Fe-4S binding protein [Candidatus Dojkabacteria bacterium]|nr:4Fe-4S binding protein [Candidatus Dojkabacteria bacterium]
MGKQKQLCINESRCIKCRLCEKACPAGAMKFVGTNAANTTRVFDKSKCIRCGLCAEVCPKNVLFFAYENEGNTLSLSKVPPFRLKIEKFSEIKEFDTTVETIQYITNKVILLRLRLKDSDTFKFLSGQYADLHFNKFFLRPYSISSTPQEAINNKFIEFTIELVDKGAGSEEIKKLKVGENLKISGPYGTMIIDDRTIEEPYIFIATGTGLAPFMSIIEDMLISNTKSPITLIFGVASETDVFYLEELKELTAKYPSFNYQVMFSRPTGEGAKYKGRVTDFLKNLNLTNPNTRIYICGKAEMIDDSVQIIKDKGLTSRYIYYEKFL